MRCIALIAVLTVTGACDVHGAERSAAAVAQFKRESPCPSTGAARGRCPGFIVDHVVPLCAGGADEPENMQWQTIPDAKRKDVAERAQCRALRQPPGRRTPARGSHPQGDTDGH